MATLTLGKSVTIDAVQSKKGDAVFVERRRRVVAPNSNELRDEPTAPSVTPKNAADEKLRAVLAAAKAREEERKAREAAEAEAAAKRAAEIEREEREYEQVREQLAARENATTVSDVEEETKPRSKPVSATPKTFTNNAVAGARRGRNNSEDEDTRPNKHSKKDFKKSGKISIHDIVMGSDEDDDEIGLRSANRRRSEASLKRFREKARAVFSAPQKVERVVSLGETITVKDLANAMAEKVGNVVKKLMEMGMMVSMNQSIDADTAELIASEFGATVKRVVVKPYADQ
ncbi:MAG: translation initiation factor IF-2 N-terminal domain-containing protein, partial [Alphaproteobacteria bacterium]|nr:translation initiation factor IF-2 N-terminal domain-containing protein [Alphaproteobacteria bacterium]